MVRLSSFLDEVIHTHHDLRVQLAFVENFVSNDILWYKKVRMGVKVEQT